MRNDHPNPNPSKRQRAAARKRGGAPSAEQRRRDAQLEADAQSVLVQPRPSILSDVAVVVASKRWTFTAEQLADIAEVRAAVAAGTIPRVGRERLARILKERYDLPWSVSSIIEHIKDTP